MTKTTTLLTAEDLLKLPSDLRCELIDGVLIENSPTNWLHGMIEVTVAQLLNTFVRSRGLGRVLSGEPGFILRRNPDLVRAPDVAFIREDRLPDPETRGFPSIPPDLVVEIVSPSDTRAEIQAKIRDWAEAAVPLQWWLYPETQSIHVIRSLIDRQELGPGDTLDGGEVLPGFSCGVDELFR